jgi:hypothetical protein
VPARIWKTVPFAEANEIKELTDGISSSVECVRERLDALDRMRRVEEYQLTKRSLDEIMGVRETIHQVNYGLQRLSQDQRSNFAELTSLIKTRASLKDSLPPAVQTAIRAGLNAGVIFVGGDLIYSPSQISGMCLSRQVTERM